MYKKQLMKMPSTTVPRRQSRSFPFFHRQSEELLAALKDDKAPPPLAAIDGQTAIEAGPRPISSLRGATQTRAQAGGRSLA